MADSALVAYRATILGFLMTCTIKNSWLADTANQQLLLRGVAVDLSEPTTWKYYVNLTGNYHAADTPMTVLSLDTQAEIAFTRDVLALHPRTIAAYRPGSEEYTQLCQRYPDQTDLIKNILFPVTDVEAAIDAKDFTLLAWGSGYLEDAETQSLVNDMVTFLTYVASRWYLDWLEVESYYRPAFWAALWQHLVALLHTSRIQNLHTAHAHTFHVWEYLKSQGIGDYRDILTRRQAMFLYRNMRHIRRNRGRQENLILLVNRLLTEQSIAMMSKSVWHEMVADEGDLIWQSEFVSDPVETDYVRSLRLPPPQTVQEITLKLNAIGADNDASSAHIERVTRRLNATRSNRLPTKMLEIQPILQDRKYAPMLNGFVLDNLVRAVNSGKYTAAITYQDANTGTILRLKPKEALALIYYAIWRTRGETPVNLPTKYFPLVGTFRSDLTVDILPKVVTHRSDVYFVSSVVDAASFIAGGRPPIGNYLSAIEFADSIGQMFATLVSMLRTTQYRASLGHVTVLEALRKASLERMPFTLELCPLSITYDTWLGATDQEDVALVIDTFEMLDDATSAYTTLIHGLLEQLVPPTRPLLAKWLDNAGSVGLFGRMKELFVQLCSYNVLFLDTGQERQNWVLLPRTLLDIGTSPVVASGRNTNAIAIGLAAEDHAEEAVYRMADTPGRVTRSQHATQVYHEVAFGPLKVATITGDTHIALGDTWAQARTSTTADTIHANIGFNVLNKSQDE